MAYFTNLFIPLLHWSFSNVSYFAVFFLFFIRIHLFCCISLSLTFFFCFDSSITVCLHSPGLLPHCSSTSSNILHLLFRIENLYSSVHQSSSFVTIHFYKHFIHYHIPLVNCTPFPLFVISANINCLQSHSLALLDNLTLIHSLVNTP